MEADPNDLSNSIVPQAEIADQTIDTTVSDQSFSTETHPQPTDAGEPAASELAELPAEISFAASTETITMTTSAEASAYIASAPTETSTPANPVVTAEAPASISLTPAMPPIYTASPAPAAPLMQPFPQAIPAQAYMPAGAIGYPGTPAFPPIYTGALPQPGYPSAYAQGGYALAPGQMQPQSAAPVTKKRGRLGLWIVLIVIVLLLLAGSNTVTYALSHPPTPKAVVHHTPSQPQPNGTLQSYCQGVTTSNAQEIYNLLSAQAKVHTSLDDIQKTFDQLQLLNSGSSSMSAQYTDCTFDNIRVSGSLAVATVSLTLTLTMQAVIQNQKQTQTVTEIIPSLTSLVWENNQWKIDFSQFAQPQPTFGLSGL